MKDVWFWSIEGGFGKREGRVQAIDPRDAVSRALTSEMGDGRLIGEALGVPLTFVAAAPGNASTAFRHEEDGVVLTVRKQVPYSQKPVDHRSV